MDRRFMIIVMKMLVMLCKEIRVSLGLMDEVISAKEFIAELEEK